MPLLRSSRKSRRAPLLPEMANGDVVADYEQIVRALYDPLWSAEKKRAASLAFTQVDVSVSRTAILSYESIVEIFKKDISAASPVVATCSTFVAVVSTACESSHEAGFTVAVVEDRVEASANRSENPAHAEIRARSIADPQVKISLTRGMANAILKSGKTEIKTVE
jgi:hypothetical protein